MSISQINFSLIIVSLLLGACSQEQEVSEVQNPFGEEVIATINDEPIYTSIFQRYSNIRLQKNVDDLSDDELTLYEQAKNESFSIQPGQTYVKVEGIWDGEFTVFRARPEVHALCIKHNIYDC